MKKKKKAEGYWKQAPWTILVGVMPRDPFTDRQNYFGESHSVKSLENIIDFNDIIILIRTPFYKYRKRACENNKKFTTFIRTFIHLKHNRVKQKGG